MGYRSTIYMTVGRRLWVRTYDAYFDQYYVEGPLPPQLFGELR